MQRVPGAAGLDRGGHVGLVDVEDAVHAADVDQQGPGRRSDIAARIAHPAAARDDRYAFIGCRGDGLGECFRAVGPDHGKRCRPFLEHVLRVKIAFARIGDDPVAAKDGAERLHQLRRGCGCRHHSAAAGCAPRGTRSPVSQSG
jgi:hypothetical protein